MAERAQEPEAVIEKFGERGEHGVEFMSHGKADLSFARPGTALEPIDEKNLPLLAPKPVHFRSVRGFCGAQAEIPSPSCVGAGSPFLAQITNARAEFDAQLSVSSSFQTANIPVQVTGVGFFDFFHNQHGAAPNVIELHPVLDIQFNPSPAGNDFAVTTAATAMHVHANSSSSLGIAAVPAKQGSEPNVKFAVTGLPAGVTSQITPGTNGSTTHR